MKKIYFLAVSLALGFSANAQITDGFESYPDGPYFGGHWSNWSGASSPDENIVVASDQFSSGAKSGYIGNNGTQDAILLMGTGRNSGTWTLEFDAYIDFGSGGYYNVQQKLADLGVTGNWGNQIYFGMIPEANNVMTPNPGVGRIQDFSDLYHEFTFDEETWFSVAHEINLDTGTIKFYIDGVEVPPSNGDPIAYPGGIGGFLEAADFYSAANFNSMYIDDVKFYEGPIMGVSDVTGATISVYPTVVKDNVNISAKSNITNVAVFNTAGQQVLKSNPNSVSTQVNMSALPAGVYIVKIQAGKETLTKKVVVK